MNQKMTDPSQGGLGALYNYAALPGGQVHGLRRGQVLHTHTPTIHQLWELSDLLFYISYP